MREREREKWCLKGRGKGLNRKGDFLRSFLLLGEEKDESNIRRLNK